MLTRAGLYLVVTTVGRFIKMKPSKDVIEEFFASDDTEPVKIRVVTAKYPDHAYHLDLSVVPTSAGF